MSIEFSPIENKIALSAGKEIKIYKYQLKENHVHEIENIKTTTSEDNIQKLLYSPDGYSILTSGNLIKICKYFIQML